jgi:hypothetical protein
MPGVAETFKTVIDEMKHGTNLKLGHMLHPENAFVTHKDLNTIIDDPEH